MLYLANALSTHTDLSVQVSSLRQCNAWFYTQLLTQLFDIEMSPLSTETARCQAVVDTLSNHLSPQVSLDHIKVRVINNKIKKKPLSKLYFNCRVLLWRWVTCSQLRTSWIYSLSSSVYHPLHSVRRTQPTTLTSSPPRVSGG